MALENLHVALVIASVIAISSFVPIIEIGTRNSTISHLESCGESGDEFYFCIANCSQHDVLCICETHTHMNANV
jgi:hypothetical protein